MGTARLLRRIKIPPAIIQCKEPKPLYTSMTPSLQRSNHTVSAWQAKLLRPVSLYIVPPPLQTGVSQLSPASTTPLLLFFHFKDPGGRVVACRTPTSSCVAQCLFYLSSSNHLHFCPVIPSDSLALTTRIPHPLLPLRRTLSPFYTLLSLRFIFCDWPSPGL